MTFWSAVAADGSPLAPRVYSTGLTQDEAVRRILAAFRKARARGESADVFFRAGTGSGKSLVALNVAARSGRAIVSIPTVNLQTQYTDDYAGGRIRVMKPDGRPLRLESVKGRARYPCPLEGGTAAEPHVCNSGGGKKESRWRRACKCPHWSPVMPFASFEALSRIRPQDVGKLEGYDDHQVAFLGKLEDATASWNGHEERFVHLGRRGCPYFDAHAGFADADVVVLNNRKWEIETDLGRKPRVDVEIFDECDHFLDGLFETQTLSIDALRLIFGRIEHPAKLLTLPEHVLRDPAVLEGYDAAAENLPDELREGFNALRSLTRRLETFRKPEDFEDAKTWKALESVPALLKALPKLARERMHTEFQGRPWATVHVESTLDLGTLTDQDENLVAKVNAFVEAKDGIVLAYDRDGVHFAYSTFAGPLRKLLEKSAPLRLWMSATLPDREILEKVYGFKDPVIIEGEPRLQGKLIVAKPPEDPPRITFKTWGEDETRKRFARLLEAIVARVPKSERMVTIVHGQQRLVDVADASPTAAWMVREIAEDAERHEERLKRFMEGEGHHLVSTRIARGVDFRGDLCRHILLLKDPIPNVNDRRFQVLRKKWSEPLFWAFVQDVADRQLVQMVGRGLRAGDDWARLWVLDAAILQRLDRVLANRAHVVKE